MYFENPSAQHESRRTKVPEVPKTCLCYGLLLRELTCAMVYYFENLSMLYGLLLRELIVRELFF